MALTALEDFQRADERDSKEEKKVDLKLDLIARMKNYRPSGVCIYESALDLEHIFVCL